MSRESETLYPLISDPHEMHLVHRLIGTAKLQGYAKGLEDCGKDSSQVVIPNPTDIEDFTISNKNPYFRQNLQETYGIFFDQGYQEALEDQTQSSQDAEPAAS